MHGFHAHADPSLTVAQRLRQLNDSLQELAVRLRDAIASAVSKAVAQALQDLLRRLLGVPLEQRPEPFHPHSHNTGFAGHDDPWQEDDYASDPWSMPETIPEPPPPRQEQRSNRRWREAVGALAQTGLWWLRRQPVTHPVLTTLLIALAAGTTVLVAGPTLGACTSVAASAAGLLFTANAATTVGGLLAA